MSTFSTRASIRKPELTDSPANIEIAAGNALDDIDKVVVPIYASTATRDTLSDGGPATGWACYITASGSGGRTLQVYDGTGWKSYFGGPRYIAKSATTSRASTTTFTADPHLTMTLEASSTYEVDLHLFVTADAAGDLKVRFTMPTGALGYFGHLAPGTLWPAGSGGGVFDGNIVALTQLAQSTPTASLDSGGSYSGHAQAHNIRGIIVMAGSSGSVTVEWAQLASNVTATELKKQSYMLVTRVA